MITHVANPNDARTYLVDHGLIDDLDALIPGALFELGEERLIIIDPPKLDGGLWRFTAAPALEVGRETGTA